MNMKIPMYLMLGVNIDHIGTLRNVRGGVDPDPVYAAYLAEQSGADSITVHLREDRRHITDRDVMLLRKTIQIPINLEMSVTCKMVSVVSEFKPNYCCLVPEKRQELTTEGGLNVISCMNMLKNIVYDLHKFGIRVSLFIDPDINQIDAACDTGVSCIELHTGSYANAKTKDDQFLEYERIKKGAQYASDRGLNVHAGHGLNYYNVQLIAMISYIQELNIGHSIISRSVFWGLSKAIKDMKILLKESRGLK